MRECGQCGALYADDNVLKCPIDGAPTVIRVGEFPEGAPQPGAVFGTYTLLRLIGVGGMGLVYLAEHTRLKRKVALKLLRPELVRDPVSIRRFFAEARAVNEVAHENIVEITDFVEEGEHRYFVMELLKGHALSDVLKPGKPLTLSRALKIARQIAAALGAAHEAGIVHRDLKPANIFLVKRGDDPEFVKVLDFGIAKVAGADVGDGEKTVAGTFVGTPAYMAPEQLSEKNIDHRVDIYALGVVMFELTTGRRPFTAASAMELVVKLMRDPPVRPSTVPGALGGLFPESLDELIFRSLSKDPAGRPQTMKEIIDLCTKLEAEIIGSKLSKADESSGEYALPVSGGWIKVPGTSSGNLPPPIEFGPKPVVAPAAAPASTPPAPAPPPARAPQGEFVEAGRAVPDTGPTATHDVSPVHEPSAPIRLPGPSPVAVGLAAAGALAVIAVIAAVVLFGGDEGKPDEGVVAAAEADAGVRAHLAPPPHDEPPAAGTDAGPVPLPNDTGTAGAATGTAAAQATAADPSAEPAPVTVHFESVPPGAKVFLHGELLGTTPFDKQVKPSARDLIAWRLDGYAPKTTSASFSEGAHVTAALAPAEKKPEKALKSGGLINPFAKPK